MKKNAKILIVDSSLDSLKLTSEIILYNGYDVIKTTSSKQSIIYAVEYLPDLIILDVIMPHIDGHTIIDEIRNYEDARDIPILVLSKSNNLDDIKKSKEVGAIDYIIKPLSINNFVKRVRKVVPLENYDGMGAYLNGDNFINEEDENDDRTHVYNEINKILSKRKTKGRIKNVIKKEKKINKIEVIDGFPVKYIAITELKEGMIPAKQVVSKGGTVIHPAGVGFNAKIIKKISEFEFEKDKIAIRG